MGIEETVATDGAGTEGLETETTTGAETATEETTTTEAGAGAAAATAEGGQGGQGAEATAEGEGEGAATEGEEGADTYKPNLKFKVMDKEHEIPKEFAPLMTDEKSEKMVRELHEKAFGLDVVKTKLHETREERNTFATENASIKRGIDGLRSIVQGAQKSGNLLKLDDFFERLAIPQELIMKYALAKVQFQELPPEQRQILEANMSAEKRAEMLEAQLQESQTEAETQAQQMKAQQLDFILAKDDYKQVAAEWDTRTGKPGSFRQVVGQVGHLAWLQSNGKVDLSPEQAVQEVIKGYGLKPATPGAPGTETPGANGAAATGKKVIQRATTTIPNLQGRSSSPLKTKPRSIEDLKKLRADMIAAENAG